MASIPTIEITPLMLACQNNNPDDVKSMLSKGAAVDAKDSNERTALLYCAENIETACIELLLSYNAQINHQDKDGYSCLHLAVICGNLAIVQYLVKMGADVNTSDGEMHSAIHWSVVCGQDEVLDLLLENNADPETADVHGAYPIHYAAQMCGQIDIWDESISRNQTKSLLILKKLIDQKVKIDVEDFDQRNAIIWAASSGSSEALLELFAAGSDPNKHEKDGLTALHCAASRGHLECIKILIEQCKTSVDIMDNNNCTPIFYAATLGQVSACSLLLKYGSNLHVQDCKGRTAYHCAAAKGQLKCLKVLCTKNSNIWLRNRRGDFPIHEAYYNKQMECVYYLMSVIKDKKASKSSNIYDGRTLLHLAAADNDLKLCKRLVADGVDVNCLMKTSSSSFMSPYDIAVLKNARDVAKYLKSIGGLIGTDVAEKNSDQIKKNFKNIIENEKNPLVNGEKDSEGESESKKPTKTVTNSSKNDLDTLPSQADKNSTSKQNKSIKKDDKTRKKRDNVIPIYDSDKTLVQMNPKATKQTDPVKDKKKKNHEAQEKIKNERTKKKIDILSGVYDKKLKKTDQNEKNGSIEQEKSVEFGESDAEADLLDLDENNNSAKSSQNGQIKKQNRENGSDSGRKSPMADGSTENDYGKDEISSNHSKKTNGKMKRVEKKEDELGLSDNGCVNEKKDLVNSNITTLPDVNERKRAKPIVTNSTNQRKKVNHKATTKLKTSDHDLAEDTSSPERYALKNKTESIHVKEFKYPTSDYQLGKKESSNLVQNAICSNEDGTVRLVIKPNEHKSYGKKNHGSLFDQQRLVLKSLYEIRRCRINNRDIIINPDLNSLLIKQYHFDIKENCKSLKELEKLLEVIAIEISEKFKKYNKRSHTLVSFKSKNQQFSRSSETVAKSSDKKALKISEENMTGSNETPSNDSRLKSDKTNAQFDQLRSAYRSLLPNDIYKQYYYSRSDTKISPQKEHPRKDQTILLPVINQKTGFTT